MLWSKKNKKEGGGLPDLPVSDQPIGDFRRVLPPIETEEDYEVHNLPAFPDSPMDKGFSQSAIKDAVENPDMEDDLPEIPEPQIPPSPRPKKMKVVEMEPSTIISSRRKIEENKPVFIRIDKFKSARESLDIINEKLSEIDTTLKSIKTVKEKEDQEILSWEKDIESIKARLNSINTEIFDSAIE